MKELCFRVGIRNSRVKRRFCLEFWLFMFVFAWLDGCSESESVMFIKNQDIIHCRVVPKTQ